MIVKKGNSKNIIENIEDLLDKPESNTFSRPEPEPEPEPIKRHL